MTKLFPIVILVRSAERLAQHHHRDNAQADGDYLLDSHEVEKVVLAVLDGATDGGAGNLILLNG